VTKDTRKIISKEMYAEGICSNATGTKIIITRTCPGLHQASV